jgi:hypothetical protein
MAARPMPPPMPGAYRPATASEGQSGLKILGKIFGYGMLAFGGFWLLVVPLVIIEGDDNAASAAMGGLLMAFLCGVPGGLVTYFVRKSDRQAKIRSQLMGLIQIHDAFSAADIAPRIGEPEFETEQLIVTLVHEHRLPLLFHARDRRYFHPDRVRQSFAVLTHCQSCGARMGSEIIFAGETRRCHYCGTPVQPSGGWAS